MKFKNNFLVNLFLLQCCSLLSYEFSHDNNSKNKIPQVEMHVNHNVQPSSNWHFSGNIVAIPDCSDAKIPMHSSFLLYQASPQLKYYFNNVVAPLIYHSAIADHYCVLPGYVFSDGLRHCLSALSQFMFSDGALLSRFTDRLETYCNRIEKVLYKGENHNFCETLSYKDQVALVRAYADFLKEFYPKFAEQVFSDLAQKNSLMQQTMPEINWCCYDGRDVESSVRDKDQRNAASVQSNLGTVYKALHEGDIAKAYTVGCKRIVTVISGRWFGKTTNVASVFERYPALYQKVEQAYRVAQAKTESYSAKATKDQQEKDMQQKAYVVRSECSEHALAKFHSDTLQKRYDAAMCNIIHSQFSTKIHGVTPLQATCIKLEHLTPDQKGILLEGGHLQHHLIDEAITVVDVLSSGDLVENMHDAVLDLANASLTLNKDGDVIMASRTLDACWALIDFAQDAAQYTYSALSTHVPLLVKGTCDGVCESLHGAVHAVCHPVETAQDVVNSFVVAGYYLGKLAYAGCVLDAATDVLESNPKRYEQMIQQYAIDPDALTAVYEHVKQNISTEDIARVGTKVAVDMMLLHGVTKVVSAIAQENLPTFLSCMRKGESAEVTLIAEGVPVRCAEEVASLMSNMEKAGNRAEVAAEVVDAKNAVTKAETTIRSADATVKKYGKQGSPYQKISKHERHARSLNRLEGKDLLGIDNIVMSGYGPLPKNISLDNYTHYLQPEIRITSKGKIKPSGWHHDPGRRMETIKRINGHKIEIENYEKHSSGIYKFEWGVEGMQKKRSTFFPHSWSRELVQSKIREAYKYARQYKIAPKFQSRTNNFSLLGFTKDGIKIEMIINQQGTIVSAYPCMVN